MPYGRPTLLDIAQQSIAVILKDYPGTPAQRPERLSEEQVGRISGLLARADKLTWSKIPRIYAVLHMIDKVQVVDSFVDLGTTDLWFPFSHRTLPDAVRSVTDRHQFLEVQNLVLTKALDLEREDGRHRHFATPDDVPLRKLAELGKGGFGSVDLVLSTITYREYARKRIPRGQTFRRNAAKLRDFERELNNLKKLRHEHIIRLVGSYTDPKFVCILLSPVADANLKEFLAADSITKRQKSLLRTFYGCLAMAVQHLHENQVRHKDIKPQNILIKDDRVFLTDFGISLDWSDSGEGTTTGDAARTERYCAPEVAQNLQRNSSSDLWSLGCVFLEIWTVLKGETLDNLDTHIAGDDGARVYYHRSPNAIMTWCNTLRARSNTAGENPALAWIKGTLQTDPNLRWTAHKLISSIADVDDDPDNHLLFFGRCCSINDDDVPLSDTHSWRSSIAPDDTGPSSIGAYEPPPPQVFRSQDQHSRLDAPPQLEFYDTAGFLLESASQGVHTDYVSSSRSTNGATSDVVDNHRVQHQGPRPDTYRPTTPKLIEFNDLIQQAAEPADFVQWSGSLESKDLQAPHWPLFHEALDALTVHEAESIQEAQNFPYKDSGNAASSDTLKAPQRVQPTYSDTKPHEEQYGAVEQTEVRVETSAGQFNKFVDGQSPVPQSLQEVRDLARRVSDDGSVWSLAQAQRSLIESYRTLLDDDTTSQSETMSSMSEFETDVDWRKSLCLNDYDDAVKVVVFSPDGTEIATSSNSWVRLLNARTGHMCFHAPIHTSPSKSIAFSPDSKLLACGSDGDKTYIWNVALGEYFALVPNHSICFDSVAFSPNGELFMLSGGSHTVKLYNIVSRRPWADVEHADHINQTVFSPDSQLVASASRDKTVRLWDTRRRVTTHTLRGHPVAVEKVAFSPDSKMVLSVSENNTIRVWDTLTGEMHYTLSGRLWNTILGGIRKPLAGRSEEVSDAAFSPDGRLIALYSSNNSIWLWDVAAKSALRLSGHQGPVTAVVFSPNSKLLASGSMDETVRIWDTKTKKIHEILDGHSGLINCVAFSPDGRLLASGSADQTCHIWGAPYGLTLKPPTWRTKYLNDTKKRIPTRMFRKLRV